MRTSPWVDVNALDRSRAKWLPRVDSRDQGDLCEELRPLSVALALFLRYDARRRRLCDEDGWMSVEQALNELRVGRRPVQGTENDVRRVVNQSYSKDRPRFELQEQGGIPYVRACPGIGAGHKNHRRRRDGVHSELTGYHQQSHETATGATPRTHDVINRIAAPASCVRGGARGAAAMLPPSGWQWHDIPSLGQVAGPVAVNPAAVCHAAASTSVSPGHVGTSGSGSLIETFSGRWAREGHMDEPVCDIHGHQLTWLSSDGSPFHVQNIEIRCNELHLQGDGSASHTGRMEADQIIWSDRDIWCRVTPAAAVTCGQEPRLGPTSSAAEAVYGTLNELRPRRREEEDDVARRRTATQTCVEGHAKEGFPAEEFGSEYLSLQKGELLSVDIASFDQGWVWGSSVQSRTSGWFPYDWVRLRH